MNVSAHPPIFSNLLPSAAGRYRRQPHGAFALVVTLIILSLLVVVAVSYLTSMSGERQTANAYTSKARAEQVAQAGVDSAMAVLQESFRDFPDSATVWDTTQSANNGSSSNSAIVNTQYNEGTSLYLRAVPTQATLPGAASGTTTTVASPQPDGAAAPSNDATGNNPCNLNCKNFVLPLISGVPGGRAQLVSNKASILPTMNLSEPDPAKQNFVDLNLRRFGPNPSSADPIIKEYGDYRGIIGSPPSWAGNGPKPARALWVNLTKRTTDPTTGNPVELVTGRYAYWIDDESFRANNNYFGLNHAQLPSQPPDNQAQPTPFPTASPTPSATSAHRSLDPSDSILAGPLTLGGDGTASNDAATIFNTRANYPGNFFPDSLAIAHALPVSSPSPSATPAIEIARYLTTNQSGTLNLTRHGTQRLNLNGVISAATIQAQLDQIVQTIKFHLPYFGERFYRTNASAPNDATQVLGSPVPSIPVNTNANIYCYKAAANILDYVDADSQPTIVNNAGKVLLPGTPTNALNDGNGGGSSEIWAEGKESGPFLQEAAVRYQPVVFTTGKTIPYNFELKIDYYLEFWNMTDRDIYASAAPANSTAPNLGGATIRIHNQHAWKAYPSGGVITCSGPNPNALTYRDSSTDEVIDLSGVVFKAGACTVITTDPGYATYVFKGPPGAVSLPAQNYPSVNTGVTYLCPVVGGQRDYTGTIKGPDYGIQESFRDPTTGSNKEDDEVQVILANGNGCIDSTLFAISEHGAEQWTGTDKDIGQPGNYNDYSYSSCLFGNATDSQLYYSAIASELGDPRTKNEQLTLTNPYDATKGGDQTRFIYGTAADTTLGYPNPSQKPDSGAYLWGDYYALPAASGGIVSAPDATTAPMVVANALLTSIGQLGDVFDPARTAGSAGIVYSRGGGRTFKIGQHDDRYSYDPSGSPNYDSNTALDYVPASTGWASWRLMDVFDTADAIEAPARININGVQRDQGAALLSLFQGFIFQPPTTISSSGNAAIDPIIHGDAHTSTGLAKQSLNATSFSVLVNQMTTRLTNQYPANGPSGPFFERGELGELGAGATALFGQNPPSQYGATNYALVTSVNMNKTFDHSREEVVRRVAQMICTRGDTFTVYAVGQSISQTPNSTTLKVTGTHRMRLTFRLVPKNADGTSFHPGYTIDSSTGAVKQITNIYINSDGSTNLSDTSAKGRFAKPDHYDTQVLQTSTY